MNQPQRHLVITLVLTLGVLGTSCRAPSEGENTDIHPLAIPTPDPAPSEDRVIQAVRTARDEVASDPTSAHSWGKLGAVLDAHGYFTEAALCYREALELAPDSFVWNYHLGITLDREAGDIDEVIELFTRAAELEPQYPPTFYRLGLVMLKAGRYDEACLQLERAIALDPSLAIARRHLGQALLALDRMEMALAQLEQAVVLDPQDGATYAALAQVYSRLGRTEEARLASDNSRRYRPTLGIPDPIRLEVSSLGVSGFLAYKRGQSALEAGNYREAIQLFEIKDEVNPSAWTFYFLGLSHRRLGDLAKAAEYYRKAISTSDHADSHWQLGEMLLEQGDAERGFQHLYQARAAGTTDAVLLRGVGASFARRGRLEEAIATFELADRLDLNTSDMEANWCGALLTLGRHEESLAHCQEAVRLDESSARAHLHLGLVLESGGLIEEAVRHYEKAFALDPDSQAKQRLEAQGP